MHHLRLSCHGLEAARGVRFLFYTDWNGMFGVVFLVRFPRLLPLPDGERGLFAFPVGGGGRPLDLGTLLPVIYAGDGL